MLLSCCKNLHPGFHIDGFNTRAAKRLPAAQERPKDATDTDVRGSVGSKLNLQRPTTHRTRRINYECPSFRPSDVFLHVLTAFSFFWRHKEDRLLIRRVVILLTADWCMWSTFKCLLRGHFSAEWTGSALTKRLFWYHFTTTGNRHDNMTCITSRFITDVLFKESNYRVNAVKLVSMSGRRLQFNSITLYWSQKGNYHNCW